MLFPKALKQSQHESRSPALPSSTPGVQKAQATAVSLSFVAPPGAAPLSTLRPNSWKMVNGSPNMSLEHPNDSWITSGLMVDYHYYRLVEKMGHLTFRVYSTPLIFPICACLFFPPLSSPRGDFAAWATCRFRPYANQTWLVSSVSRGGWLENSRATWRYYIIYKWLVFYCHV